METDNLIEKLAAHASPVRRLRPPWVRMLAWFAVSGPFVAAVVIVMSGDHAMEQAAIDWQLVVEQSATLATALTAAVAAFGSTVPGYDRRILWLPVVPVAIWLATLGHGCAQDWVQHGADGLVVRP